MGVMVNNYNATLKDGYFDDDIEKGEVNVKVEDGILCGSNAKMRELYSDNTNSDGLGSDNLSVIHEEKAISYAGSSSDDDLECVRLIVVDKKVVEERNNGDFERKVVKEKSKAMSAKKPPRPPRGLSLDSSDQKMIKELHELARLKRARVERLKALKKGKEAKVTSSKNQLLATLLTILFCLVLLLQGMSSRTSTTTTTSPPFSSEVAEQHKIISVGQYPVSPTTNHNGPGSHIPRLVEQVSGADALEQMSRAVG